VQPATAAERNALAAAERRVHQRLTVSELSWLDHIRLKYGPIATLLDLSTGGAQIETTNHCLLPGATLVIQIAGHGVEFAVPSQVLRCHVSGIGAHTTYRGALLFKRPIKLPEFPSGTESASDCNPLHECARLSLTMRRLSLARHGDPVRLEGHTGVGTDVLSAARALIESPSARRAGATFPRKIGELLRAVTRHVENGTPHDALIADILERLRRTIPSQTINLVSAAGLSTARNPDAIYLDVPPVSNRPPAKLLVEFPRTCRLEDWHLQFLKMASQLIALMDEVEGARSVEPPAPEPPKAVDRPGWNRLIVRYTDGRLLRGYGRSFHPADGQVHLCSVPDGPPASRITVPLGHLKAVFFVHDFDGRVANDSDPVECTPGTGRRITVTFLDGEVLAGTTLNYSAEGPGFFVLPLDDRSNNQRVFVVTTAIRHVQFA
jgi:hypothetical protein